MPREFSLPDERPSHDIALAVLEMLKSHTKDIHWEIEWAEFEPPKYRFAFRAFYRSESLGVWGCIFDLTRMVRTWEDQMKVEAYFIIQSLRDRLDNNSFDLITEIYRKESEATFDED